MRPRCYAWYIYIYLCVYIYRLPSDSGLRPYETYKNMKNMHPKTNNDISIATERYFDISIFKIDLRYRITGRFGARSFRNDIDPGYRFFRYRNLRVALPCLAWEERKSPVP